MSATRYASGPATSNNSHLYAMYGQQQCVLDPNYYPT